MEYLARMGHLGGYIRAMIRMGSTVGMVFWGGKTCRLTDETRMLFLVSLLLLLLLLF